MREDRQRLDKWLWFARLVKSRTLAAKLVGDVLTVAAARTTAVVRVEALGTRRGPAPEARLLYSELGRDDGALVTAPDNL